MHTVSFCEFVQQILFLMTNILTVTFRSSNTLRTMIKTHWWNAVTTHFLKELNNTASLTGIVLAQSNGLLPNYPSTNSHIISIFNKSLSPFQILWNLDSTRLQGIVSVYSSNSVISQSSYSFSHKKNPTITMGHILCHQQTQC